MISGTEMLHFRHLSHCLLLTTAMSAVGCVSSGNMAQSPRQTSGLVAQAPRSISPAEENLPEVAGYFESQGNLRQARSVYEQICRQTPQDSAAWSKLAILSAKLGDHEQAGYCYEKAIELSPQDARLRSDAGFAAILRGDYPVAEHHLQTSLQMQPQNQLAASNLALALARQQKDTECLNVANTYFSGTQRTDLLNRLKINELTSPVTAPTKMVAAIEAPKLTVKAVTNESPRKAQVIESSTLQLASTPIALNQNVNAELPSPTANAGSRSDDDKFTLTSAAPRPLRSAREPIYAPPAIELGDEDDGFKMPILNGPVASTPPARIADHDVELVRVPAPATIDEPFFAEESAPSTTAVVFLDDDLDDVVDTAEGYEKLRSRSDQSGLLGFCIVSLTDDRQLIDADPRYTAEYRGQTFSFSSPAAREAFWQDADRYVPAAGGLDAIAVKEGHGASPGSLKHAAWYRGRLYLFTNASHLERFRAQPKQYLLTSAE